jgi:hypothetical protein
MIEPIRAFHIDLKRAMWQRAYLDRYLDILKQWNYNAIVLEIENKLDFRDHPWAAHPDAWSHDEAADFAESCRNRGLQVIPLVQTLGHLEWLVGRAEYAHLREAPEFTTHVDVTNPDSLPLVQQLVDEVVEVFGPQEYVHLGADETWELGKSERCGKIEAAEGEGSLYVRHMRPLLEHVLRKGLRPIIWADMILTHPSTSGEIPRDVVLMDWDYWTDAERPRHIMVWGGGRPTGGINQRVTAGELDRVVYPPFQDHLRRFAVDDQTERDGTFPAYYCTDFLRTKGFDVLTASANKSAGDMAGVPFHEIHLPNCYVGASKGVRDAGGFLVTSWAVRHNHPELGLPGVYAASRGAVEGRGFDRSAVLDAFTRELFHVGLQEFDRAVERGGIRFAFGNGATLAQAAAAKDASVELRRHVALHGGRFGGLSNGVVFLEGALAAHEEAKDLLRDMKRRTDAEQGNLDFWLEGVDHSALCARVLLAAFRGELSSQAPALAAQIREQREQTRSLFQSTYCTESVSEELALRYGFLERAVASA